MASQLLSFIICGVCIGLLFDLFRIKRKIFKTPNFLIYIEDVLFWILAGFLLIYTIITYTDGQIRSYMIFTLITGGIMYFWVCSKYIIKINITIADYIKQILMIILKPFIIIFSKIKKILKK